MDLMVVVTVDDAMDGSVFSWSCVVNRMGGASPDLRSFVNINSARPAKRKTRRLAGLRVIYGFDARLPVMWVPGVQTIRESKSIKHETYNGYFRWIKREAQIANTDRRNG